MQRQGKKVEVEVPKTTKDLSMSDRAPFALFEYSVSLRLLTGIADLLMRRPCLGGASTHVVELRHGFRDVQLLQKNE